MPLHLPSSDPDPPFSYRILPYGNLLLHFALAPGGHARVRTAARHVRSHHPHPPPRARMAAAATPFARGTAIAIGMLFFSPFYFLISLQLIYRCGRDLLHYTILALAQEDVAG